MALKHQYKSLKPDPADATVIGASKWNADHYYVDSSGAAIATEGTILVAGTAGLIGHRTWLVPSATGHLSPTADNVYDLGTSSLRPRAILAGTAFRAPAGTAATPGYSFAADTSTGLINTSGGIVDHVSQGTAMLRLPRPDTRTLLQRADGIVGWTSNTVDQATDTTLSRVSAGVLWINTGLALGTNPAAGGALRLANLATIMGRNAANTGDLQMLMLDASNMVRVGQAGLTALLLYANDIRWMVPLVTLGGGATATLGTIGGTGPATATQNRWMRVLDDNAVPFWVPAWK